MLDQEDLKKLERIGLKIFRRYAIFWGIVFMLGAGMLAVATLVAGRV